MLASLLIWLGFRFVLSNQFPFAMALLILGIIPLLPIAAIQDRISGQRTGLTKKQAHRALMIAAASVLLLGTVTALWGNPLFIRMTSTNALDLTFLLAGSLLFGLFLVLPKQQEGKKCGVAGGVFAFLGFACPVCNKLIILLLGVAGTWTFIEPARPYLGVLGIVLLSSAIGRRFHLPPYTHVI